MSHPESAWDSGRRFDDPLRTMHLLEPATATLEAFPAWRPAPLVYLAGPIAGHTHDTATAWRDDAAHRLSPDIICLSPMRFKDYLRGELKIVTTPYMHPLSTDAAVVARDRFDVGRCNLVLANFLPAERASIGSCVEFGWADAFRKPVVAVVEPGSVHDHPMLRQIAGWTVPTLEEAYEIVRAILLP